ncbi:MAG: multiubiquitin domain-containing protein [Terriglobia bacterium]
MAETTSEAQAQAKQFTIIVNGREKKVTTNELSYKQVVDLAFDNNPPTGPNIVITVTYRNAEDNKQGTLMAGQTVKIKNGTIFNVTATDKS